MGDLVLLDLDPFPPSEVGGERRLALDDRIMLPVGQAWRLVKLRAIDLIYAAGDYSEVHLADASHLVTLRSLRCWERRLPEKHFIRVHRSAIVNADAIDRLEEWFNSSFRIHLRNRPEPLISSRRYASVLRSRFR
jgi:two-component system, LytTR family, response regulator